MAERIQPKSLAEQIKPLIRRQVEEEEEEDTIQTELISPVHQMIQKQADLGEEEEEPIQTKSTRDQITPLVQKQDEAVEEKEEQVTPKLNDTLIQKEGIDGEDEQIQTKISHSQDNWRLQKQNQWEEDQLEPIFSKDSSIQSKDDNGQQPQLSSAAAANIRSFNGGGSPLSESARSFFEPRFGTDFGEVKVHANTRAAETAKSINAKAFTVGNNIAFGANQYAPEAFQGRQLLAHELTHVLQQNSGSLQRAYPQVEDQVPQRITSLDQGTEIEGGFGTPGKSLNASGVESYRSAGRGGHVMRQLEMFSRYPVNREIPGIVRLDSEATEKEREREQKLLENPLPANFSVQFQGLVFTPPKGAEWVAGLSKELQGLAICIKALTGKGYRASLVHKAKETLEAGPEGLLFYGNLVGKAIQNEPMEEFIFKNSVVLRLVAWLKDKEGFKTLAIDEDRLEKLRIGTDADAAWDMRRYATYQLPGWFSKALFYDRVLSKQFLPLLKTFRSAEETYNANKEDSEARQNLLSAINAIYDRLEPHADLIEKIRTDESLTDHPQYRGLWLLEAVDPESPKVPIVDERSQIQVGVCQLIWIQARTNKAAGAKARGTGKAASAARRKLLDGVRGILKEHGVLDKASGDAKLRDLEARANAPPVPSDLRAYPRLGPPFFDVASGAARTFEMSLTYPTNLEAVAAHFVNRYSWEIIHVPENDWARLQKTAEDMKAKGFRPGVGDVLIQDLSRQAGYAKTDFLRVAKTMQGIEAVLGPYGNGATSLVASSRGLAMVGVLIKRFIRVISKPVWEEDIAFEKPGLYVVRCSVTASASEEAQYLRASSVAWLPVWVREPTEMGEKRMELALRLRSKSLKRLEEIEEELKNKDLDPEARKARQDEQNRLQIGLTGSMDQVLVQEKRDLNARKIDLEQQKTTLRGRDLELVEFELKGISKRILEIDRILEIRKNRIDKLGTGKLEGPIRIPAQFVGDKSQTIALSLEALQRPASKGKFIYHMMDATTKKSSEETGPENSDRTEAIALAIKELLEKHSGYGRGYCTIHVPPVGGGVAKIGEKTDVKALMRTIRIDADLTAISMEGLESLSTIISVAALAAAPFTGGSSLVLMIPAGLIGAVPSAYRLYDQSQTGTFEMDLAAAMDIVNVVGSVVGVGQVSAGARFVRVGRGLMVLGLGADGLGVAIAGAQFVEAASNIDPNAPPGLRRAMLMELVAQQLMTVGMMVGASLARKAAEAKGTAAIAPDMVGLKRSSLELHAEVKAKAGGDTPIFEDTNLKGDSAEVRYRLDGYGLVTDIYIAKAENASKGMVLKHAETVATMRKFSGLQGYLRSLMDKVTLLFTGKTKAKVGSRGWEAKLELEKLPEVIRGYQEEVKVGKMKPADAERKILDLQAQMKRHETALNDLQKGVGKVASEDTHQAAVDAGYPEKLPKDHYYAPDGEGGFRLERKADSDVIPQRVRPKKRGEGFIIEKIPVETPSPKPISQATIKARADLATRYPGSEFKTAEGGGDLITIDGQLTVHPEFLKSLQAGEQDQFVAAAADLKVNGGDFDKCEASTKDIVKKYRLKHQPTAQVAASEKFIDQILKDIGAKTPTAGRWKSAQARELFSNLGEFDIAALKRFADQKGGKANTKQRTSASAYAMSKNPRNVSEFVGWVEAWWELYKPRRKALWDAYLDELDTKVQIAKDAESSPEAIKAVRKAVGQKHFRKDFPSQADASEKARRQLSGKRGTPRVEQIYDADKRVLGGRYGGSDIGPETTSDKIVDALRKAPPTFGSEPTALYHPRKHYDELPKVEQKGNIVQDYMTSLHTTIKTGTGSSPVMVPNGSYMIEFTRTVDGVTLQAIVYVDRNGHAAVATYGAKK